jgi:phage terminase large subunit-like protein
LGPSGICRLNINARWNDKRNAIVWPNGTIALGFGCYTPEDVERLRGNNFDVVWWDEVAAARYLDECFEMMDMALRQSDAMRPHAIMTTTPKPKKRLKQLIESADSIVVKATTADNKHLTDEQREYMYRQYGGTRLGRQELLAEILDDVEGALWSHEMIATAKDAWPEKLPDMHRIVVAIDPAVTSGDESDMTGIIVAGRDTNGHGYIFEDCTLKGSPEQWATAAIRAYARHGADRIIGEVNNGGDLVEHTLRSVDPNIPYRAVRASRGKRVRAEPIAALYERKLIHHAPGLDMLEEELVTWEPDGVRRSPDRLDALVWAMTELALTQNAMFNLDAEKHVVPLLHDASNAHQVIEAWRFGWDRPTAIVWVAWTPGETAFVIAEHEKSGEPNQHAAVARTVRALHKVKEDRLVCVALPTIASERNFHWEYAAHGIYIGENRNGPSVDARRARLARELNRLHKNEPAIVINERCLKLQSQIRLMRFGDTKPEQVPEGETGLADALALAVTLIPEPETPVPIDFVKFARDHGIATPGVVGTIQDALDPQEQEIELWEPNLW